MKGGEGWRTRCMPSRWTNEPYERQIKDRQEAYGEAMLEVRPRRTSVSFWNPGLVPLALPAALRIREKLNVVILIINRLWLHRSTDYEWIHSPPPGHLRSHCRSALSGRTTDQL